MSLNRRDVLRLAGVGALLTACGGAPGAAPVQNAVVEARRGGVLRAVFTGGGAAESIDPFAGGSPVDFVRNDVIYDALFALRGAAVEPALALSATPGPSSFELKLRPDVKWHDGKAFTASDVEYSLKYMCSPDRPYPTQLGAFFDVANVRVVDPLTLVVPTTRAVGDPALFLAAFPAKIVPSGFTGASAVGTGPFRVTAFEAGREARLERFDGHWGGSSPADSLVLLSLSDPAAKVNAVSTGQADFAGDIPFTTAKTGVPGFEVRTAGPAARTSFGFVLNATKAPFNDPRARRAVRLGIDRSALVNSVLLGYGAVGNDLLCAGAKYFTAREPLKRDVDQARKLLSEAGLSGASVTFRSAEWEIGYNASTQLVAEQLKEIGLTVKPQIVGPAEFFEPAAVAAADAVAFSSGPSALAVIYGRISGFPPLALGDKEFDEAFGRAIASASEAERASAWETAQNVMYDRGNTVVWGLADVLSLARREVAGVDVRDQPKYPYLGKAGLA
ncbi:peptide/nickel transport system substrate-binding protein [Lentzea atacamensis]|uniref:Peptide/nickel transport system substrate-binding protein n=1 Tax=Lentzea atacamensis TaxID=531938 RepID=A0ABX9ELU8_9PSEU|nr:ABC transporter substrate-binding protein [Lentzea atacamensis]RAS71116.1 peptide/nickel transport system substrate-binding protein [Lentzea atacamensis]